VGGGVQDRSFEEKRLLKYKNNDDFIIKNSSRLKICFKLFVLNSGLKG